MTLRAYQPKDNKQIVELFINTVHAVNSQDYTAEQQDAWAPDSIDVDLWCKPFQADYTLVVEAQHKIVGFGNLTEAGYFDRLYVHKDYQRKGIATMIADAIEEHARAQSIRTLKVDASITAKPFFTKRGYDVISENAVERCGQKLVNYSMSKSL